MKLVLTDEELFDVYNYIDDEHSILTKRIYPMAMLDTVLCIKGLKASEVLGLSKGHFNYDSNFFYLDDNEIVSVMTCEEVVEIYSGYFPTEELFEKYHEEIIEHLSIDNSEIVWYGDIRVDMYNELNKLSNNSFNEI